MDNRVMTNNISLPAQLVQWNLLLPFIWELYHGDFFVLIYADNVDGLFAGLRAQKLCSVVPHGGEGLQITSGNLKEEQTSTFHCSLNCVSFHS